MKSFCNIAYLQKPCLWPDLLDVTGENPQKIDDFPEPSTRGM